MRIMFELVPAKKGLEFSTRESLCCDGRKSAAPVAEVRL